MARDIFIETGKLSSRLLNNTCDGLNHAYEKLSLFNGCPAYQSPLGHLEMYSSDVIAEIISLQTSLQTLIEKVRAYAEILDTGPVSLSGVDAKYEKDFTTGVFGVLHSTGYGLFSWFSKNEVLQPIWSDIKEKLKVFGLSEEVVDILGEDFGDKPEVFSVLGDLTKVEKILKAIDDPTSSDSLIDGAEAFLKLCGLEDWVASSAGGLSGTEAGLIIDLAFSGTKNLAENTTESVGLIQELINDPDASISDYLKTISYVRYNLGDGVLVEGFFDVVLDKADTIGYLTGMNEYAEKASGGQYSAISDVYYDFVDLYKSNVETFGSKKATEIYLDAFAGNIKDSVAPWIGPVTKLLVQ